MLTPERESEAVLGNIVTAIASTLCPGAMLACPVLRTILLQRSMRLPGAVLGPSPLLLPRDCLLLGTLRLLPARLGTLGLLLWRSLLLSLLGPLLLRSLPRSSLLGPLLWRLLSRSGLMGPLLWRLLPRSSLLGPLLLRLLSRSGLLRPLLLRLPFGLAFFLRVRRVNRPEESKQGSGTDNSNQLHLNHPPSLSLLCLHSDNQSA